MPASLSERSVRHLSQIDLARRWAISPRTLERWRWLRQGPPYLKIGGRVAYRLEDVEVFEAERLQLERPNRAVAAGEVR
ncbi:MAG TPA: DNA-binding protein [Roseomonas sp.]|nr:DNA-binding protein [Roseomonas sp.]